MGRRLGDKIGGIRTIEDLRQRCFINEDTGCWEWRGAMQRTAGRTEEPRVWLANKRVTSTIGRASWILAGKRELKAGETVWRRCRCETCGNPDHLSAGTKKQWGAWVEKRGHLRQRLERKIINRRVKMATGQAKLTPELAQWAIESPQTGVEVAWALNVSNTTVSRARLRQCWAPLVPTASVFALGMSL